MFACVEYLNMQNKESFLNNISLDNSKSVDNPTNAIAKKRRYKYIKNTRTAMN